MSLQPWVETLITAQVDGTALTAAAAASCLPPAAKYTLSPNFFAIGKKLRIHAMGRISCAATTPGSARFDVRLGSTVVFDTTALNLNIVAKTNVTWWLDIDLTCRSIGPAATLIGVGRFASEAVVGSPTNTTGGIGILLGPTSAPAVGTSFDSTASQQLDVFFTQTVGTGSLTLHTYSLESCN